MSVTLKHCGLGSVWWKTLNTSTQKTKHVLQSWVLSITIKHKVQKAKTATSLWTRVATQTYWLSLFDPIPATQLLWWLLSDNQHYRHKFRTSCTKTTLNPFQMADCKKFCTITSGADFTILFCHSAAAADHISWIFPTLTASNIWLVTWPHAYLKGLIWLCIPSLDNASLELLVRQSKHKGASPYTYSMYRLGCLLDINILLLCQTIQEQFCFA